LVVTGLILVACGVTGKEGIAAVLGVAAIVCVSAAVAGEMFQDLKAGHLIGGTPWKMQTGNIIGAVISGLVLFGVIIILHQGDVNMGLQQGYVGGVGSDEIPAPQATLMAHLATALVDGGMTWVLIIAGMLMGTALILMGIKGPMLIFVGMFLPFATVCAIFAGGLIKGILDIYTARRKYDEKQLLTTENTGVLLASGLIAGQALMGLLVAVFAIFNVFFSNMLGISQPQYFIGLIIVAIMAYYLIMVPLKEGGKTKQA